MPGVKKKEERPSPVHNAGRYYDALQVFLKMPPEKRKLDSLMFGSWNRLLLGKYAMRRDAASIRNAAEQLADMLDELARLVEYYEAHPDEPVSADAGKPFERMRLYIQILQGTTYVS